MAGWQRVMAQLVHERGRALKAYGFLLCGDDVEAADLVQEASLRVFTRPRAGWDVGAAEAYVRRAMLNRFLDQQRRSARCASDQMDILVALRSLSPRQRACVILRYYEDGQVADIADLLGCGTGTVKRYLNEAIGRLRVRLEVS